MKKFFSLSELGSCCRPQAALGTADRDDGGSCATGGNAPRRLRRAPTRSRCSAAQWRPGLPVISEDPSASRPPAVGNKTGPSTARSKVVGSTANNKNRCSTKDDYRTNSVPVIIPAFSPTPFVF